MNTVLNKKKKQNGLEISKILTTNTKEVLLVNLDKSKIFPKHTSPTDALLVVLEGEIEFYINDTSTTLKQDHTYSFEKQVEHYVVANKNSKFLIIR